MVLDGCPWLIGVLFLISCQGAVGTNNYLFGCKTNIWATVVNPEMHIQKSRFQTDDKNDKKKKKKAFCSPETLQTLPNDMIHITDLYD